MTKRSDLHLRSAADVSSTPPADGQVIAWDTSVNQWVPSDVTSLVVFPEVDLTDIVIDDNTANAFRVREGANNYIHVDTSDTGATISLGNASTNPRIETLGSGYFKIGSGVIEIENTTPGALLVVDASLNTYVSISSDTGSYGPLLQFGNDTNNPDLMWTGSGAWYLGTSAGTVGQVLSTNGTGGAPSWLTLPAIPDAFDPEDVLISASSATALRIHDGTSNWLLFDAGTNAISVGNAADNPAFTWLGTGAWTVAGSAGTAGQIFTSNGGAAAPSWQDAPDTFDPENVLISASSATAFRVHDGTSNWLLFNASANTIGIGNSVDNPDVSILGEGDFIMLGRFSVTDSYVINALPTIFGREPTSATPQDGETRAEGGSGSNVEGATVHHYAGISTGNADPGEHHLHNSIRGSSGTTAQAPRPNHIFAGDRRLLRTHGDGNDTAVHRHQSTNEATFHAVHVQEWEAVEDPPFPPPTLVGTITFPDDFNGTLRGHLNFINNYVGYDDVAAEYQIEALSGAAVLKALISDGDPAFMGVGDLVIDSVTYRTLPYLQEELLGISATESTLLLARSTAAGTIDLYAIGGSGTVDGDEIDGNVLIDARWHALEYNITPGSGTPPTITSFTVDVTGAGSPGGTASCRAGVETLDFAWTATGDATITYSIDQGVGAVSGGAETGVTSVEGVTVYTLTATNGAGNDTATVTVTGVRQVITRYTWDGEYWGSDFANPWPERNAVDDSLAQKGNAATGAQSTTGLTALALPAALVDNGVLCADTTGSSTQGYAANLTSGAGHIVDNTCFHLRLIVKPDENSTARLLLQHYQASTNYWNLRLANATNFRFAIAKGGVLTNFDCAGGIFIEDAWHVVDVIFDRNGGTGGQARVIIRVDGVEELNDDTAGTQNLAAFTSSSLLGIMGSRTGATSHEGTYLFYGYRTLSAYTDFTLADHQADTTALGY